MKYEVHIEVLGRVQGVSFRSNVKKLADKLGVTGYVKNTRDGKVFILAQGTDKDLQNILTFSQKGVFPAKVRGMNFSSHNISKEYKDFSVQKERSFIPDQLQSFKNLGKEILGLNDEKKVPKHVVIVPDGNRRWAKAHGLQPWKGHQMAGDFERIFKLFSECKKIGVKYLTLWAFSTENWKRDNIEVKTLMNLFRKNLEKGRSLMMKEGIRFRHFGRKDRLPKDLAELLVSIEKETTKNTKLNLQLCIDYGGRDEIARAFNRMVEAGVKSADENTISGFLDSFDIPDPDLLIRTSGEKRLSGIMPFQTTYSELYFTDVSFPDFGTEEFREAVYSFGDRVRRFGGTV